MKRTITKYGFLTGRGKLRCNVDGDAVLYDNPEIADWVKGQDIVIPVTLLYDDGKSERKFHQAKGKE